MLEGDLLVGVSWEGIAMVKGKVNLLAESFIQPANTIHLTDYRIHVSPRTPWPRSRSSCWIMASVVTQMSANPIFPAHLAAPVTTPRLPSLAGFWQQAV